MLNVYVVALLKARGHDVSPDLVDINMSNFSLFTVKDLGNLLKGRTAGFDVEDGDEDKLEEDPALLHISVLCREGRQIL